MQWKDVCKKFLLGGFVDYKEHLYDVIGTNHMKKTVTLQRANSTDKILDVPVSELTDDDLRLAKKG